MSSLAFVYPGLAEKVEFLSDPANYPERPRQVEAIETHLSWVFLTDRHAFKMKKPVRMESRELTNVTGRREHCRMEIALNKRLTDGVYFQAIPLAIDEEGHLGLQVHGPTIDWLILMRRLTAERMLDGMIREERLKVDELRPLVERLVLFHAKGPALRVPHGEFTAHFGHGIEDNAKALEHPDLEHLGDRIATLCVGQRDFIAREREAFEARVSAGRVVEGHGDLRPEHVCLEPMPQVIDCLEFSRMLRVVDSAEEFAFLALECERLGAAWVKRELFLAREELAGEHAPEDLVAFYQSYHAAVRAKVAIWHLRDPQCRDRARWVARAESYIGLAEQHLAEANLSA